MPYKNKADRNYKKEWALQQARDEKPARAARARARYAADKAGVDRTGKDIDHKTPLSKGGSPTGKNTRLVPASTNRSFRRNSDHSVKANKPYPKARRNPVQNG
jgi:hypothetical protein